MGNRIGLGDSRGRGFLSWGIYWRKDLSVVWGNVVTRDVGDMEWEELRRRDRGQALAMLVRRMLHLSQAVRGKSSWEGGDPQTEVGVRIPVVVEAWGGLHYGRDEGGNKGGLAGAHKREFKERHISDPPGYLFSNCRLCSSIENISETALQSLI